MNFAIVELIIQAGLSRVGVCFAEYQNSRAFIGGYMRVRFFVRFWALFFFWVSTTAQGATVESPCTEAALLKVMPGGEDYDGVVNFACDQ